MDEEGRSSGPRWAGIRTQKYKFIEYPTGEIELYDLDVDPNELESQHANPDYNTLLVGGQTLLNATRGLMMTVEPAEPVGEDIDLPDAFLGQPYSFQLTAWGGKEPYMWSITSNSLPLGLSLSSSGLVSGTPTIIDDRRPMVMVTDSSYHEFRDGAQTYQQRLRIKVL